MLAEFAVRFQKEVLKKGAPPSPSNMTFVKQARDVEVALLLAVLKLVGAEEAVDYAPNHCRRMIRGGADALVEIHWFLVGFGEHPSILDVDCEIKKVYQL